jgi:hypothetical protein
MRHYFLVFLASSLLLLASCAAKVPASGSSAGRLGTPIENALAYNASLADANQTLANAAISANKAGFLSVTATTNVTSAQYTVADADRQVTAMLDAIAKCISTAAAAKVVCRGNAAQLQTLITRITANVSTLDNAGELGIQDTGTKQTVDTALKTIATMAGLVLDTMQSGGLIQ